jgi:hypothetical protein
VTTVDHHLALMLSDLALEVATVRGHDDVFVITRKLYDFRIGSIPPQSCLSDGDSALSWKLRLEVFNALIEQKAIGRHAS